MIDTITAGTAAANKAVVLDGSKNIATIGTIGSGAITATGTSSFATGTTVGNLTLADGSITDSSGTISFGNENISSTGTATLSTVDIGAGAIDGTTIGAASAAAGTFAAVAGTTGTFSGILKTDDTTAATSTTDGSLQTDGGLSVAADAIIGDDIYLLSDSAVLGFGAGKDVTLTHTNDVGVTLNSTMKLMFNDATQFIQGASGTVLDIAATDEIELTATLIDVVGNFANSGTIASAGVVTANAGVVIDNITIDGTEIDLSSGDLTLDVAGDIILDAGGVNVLPGADNTHDLGAAATRWKTMYGQQFHMDASADGIADHDYAGMSITVRVGDGADIGAMDLVCISDVTNEVQIADASAIATSKVMGINPSNSAISDNAEGTILLFGIVRDDSWGWTTGQTLYLSETAGDIAATAPTTSGAFVVPIGIALEPDMIYFHPSQTIIEHA